mmetsp:Transcript_5878/g.10084  ORF Transcript_5878/g.10084 Transcript_5878/m.10084 type:complete len:280 (+) Transcript_5878:1340-2179(+)
MGVGFGEGKGRGGAGGNEGLARWGRGGAVGGRERDAERERAAHALAAPHLYAPRHQRQQVPRDREAESDAAGAMLADLDELVEDLRNRVGGYAWACVGGLEHDRRPHQLVVLPQRRHVQHHLSVSGELDRVADDVDQHLPHSHRVPGDEAGNGVVDVAEEKEGLGTDAVTTDEDGVVDAAVQVKLFQLQHQLARFDFRPVHDIGDEAEEVARAHLDCAQQFPAVPRACQRRRRQRVRAHQHRVERRLQFVTHHREELGLALRFLLGLLLHPETLVFAAP